jgi:hypothetical protein
LRIPALRILHSTLLHVLSLVPFLLDRFYHHLAFFLPPFLFGLLNVTGFFIKTGVDSRAVTRNRGPFQIPSHDRICPVRVGEHSMFCQAKFLYASGSE